MKYTKFRHVGQKCTQEQTAKRVVFAGLRIVLPDVDNQIILLICKAFIPHVHIFTEQSDVAHREADGLDDVLDAVAEDSQRQQFGQRDGQQNQTDAVVGEGIEFHDDLNCARWKKMHGV